MDAEAEEPIATEEQVRKKHDPYAALRLRDYRLYAAGNVAGVIGWQMVSVVVGWELYERTNSKTALGLVGLVQVIPLLLLSLHAGHMADRYNRRKIILVAQIILTLAGLMLGVASLKSEQIPDLPGLQWCNDQCAATAAWLG